MGVQAFELLDGLCDAFGWPRTRPPRLVVGDRASAVDALALCVNEAAVDGLQDPQEAVFLATPAGATFARAGRRAHDVFIGGEGPASDWARAERVVIDASELLAGGVGGFDELLLSVVGADAGRPARSVQTDLAKFVAFVPEADLPDVRAAVFAAGAGHIGEYSECSWSTVGMGTFRGSAATSPAAGEAGRFEQVSELRFETICPLHLCNAVVSAFVAAHPYEEPAYDVYRLVTPAKVGLGRVAEAVDPVQAQEALGQRFGECDLYPAGAAGAGGLMVATSGPLSPILTDVLALDRVTLVIASAVTPAERLLLGERGVHLALVSQEAIAGSLGDHVATGVAGLLGIPVRLAAPLQFPGAAS